MTSISFFQFFEQYLGYSGSGYNNLDSTIAQYALAAELITYVFILFGIFVFFRRLFK